MFFFLVLFSFFVWLFRFVPCVSHCGLSPSIPFTSTFFLFHSVLFLSSLHIFFLYRSFFLTIILHHLNSSFYVSITTPSPFNPAPYSSSCLSFLSSSDSFWMPHLCHLQYKSRLGPLTVILACHCRDRRRRRVVIRAEDRTSIEGSGGNRGY